MTIETGSMIRSNVELALYKFYVDASDAELSEAGVSRDEVLSLARSFDQSGYRDAELSTIAKQILCAYKAGKSQR